METVTAEAALARLERAISELCGVRERLAESLEQALEVVGDTIAGLELRLDGYRELDALLGAPAAD